MDALAMNALAFLAVASGQTAELGTFTTDVVAYLKTQQEVSGKSTTFVIRDGWRYLFSSEENRRAFLRNPEAYEVQMGGACARMGELSGLGDPGRHAAVGGRLYIFASDNCRETFLADPSTRVFQPDPSPRPTADQIKAGRALAGKVLAWAGGRQMVPGLFPLQESWSEEVQARGTRYVHQVDRSYGRQGEFAMSDLWNKTGSHFVLADDDGEEKRDGKRFRVLARQQQEALQRESIWAVPAIYRLLAEGKTPVWSDQASVLSLHLYGTTVSMRVDPRSGRPASLFGKGRSSTAALGQREVVFSGWVRVNRLMLPSGWSAFFQSAPDDAFSRPRVKYTVGK